MRANTIFLTLLTFILFSCQNETDKLYQYSTIDMLMSGNYDGNTCVGDIKNKGDFGIGTFNSLDGEMVILNGIVYQAKKNGHVSIAGDEVKSPYVSVCHFKPTQKLSLGKITDLSALETAIKEQTDDINVVYAIKIEGVFDSISLRTVASQEKPYKPLVEVVTQQSVFSGTNSRGTLVGFLGPASLGKVIVSGLHMHYISSDFKKAGYVLTVSFSKAPNYEISRISEFDLQLMAITNQEKAGITSEEDIQKVER